MDGSAADIRAALLAASEALLSGEAIGPLTGVRLVELAGTKRHRLTHDNPDIAAAFKERAGNINRTKPEVERLQVRLKEEQARNARLVEEATTLRNRVELYASRIAELTSHREGLLKALDQNAKVSSIRRTK